MSKCLQLRGEQYFVLDTLDGSSVNLPIRIQVNLPGNAEWLVFNPGIHNKAGAGANGEIGVRIYRGNSGQARDEWSNTISPVTTPSAPLVALFQALIPWNDRMAFIVEVYSADATFTNRFFDFSLQFFDGASV